MSTLEHALETAMSLPPAEFDDFMHILQKRRSQIWRKETAQFYKKLKKEIQKGKLEPIEAGTAIEELHSFAQSEDSSS